LSGRHEVQKLAMMAWFTFPDSLVGSTIESDYTETCCLKGGFMAFIRLATEQDAEQIQEIYSPVVSHTATSFEEEPPTVEEMRLRIDETLIHFPWLVCEQQEKILGYAYASKHRTRAAYQWSVDVSVYIRAEARRKGIGRALYRSLFRILALQGFYNAYAGIALPNPGSVGLHESLGFEPIGVYKAVGYKLDAWRDVGWWHLLLQPKVESPQQPVNLQAIFESEEWETALAVGLSLLKM
jgi:phosphinothricin acetyltransferase